MKSFFWKQFECEICKTPYPYVFEANHHAYNLVDVDLPATNFLLLQSLTFEKNSYRMVYLIRPDSGKKSFSLGRENDIDCKVHDISISRCHAMIKFDQNQFSIEDNLSKFGTLVLARSSVNILPDQMRVIQIGRSVLTLSVKR